jgi:hypothetical protein
MPVPLPVNESFPTGAGYDYAGSNWRAPIANGLGCAGTDNGAVFHDVIGGETPSHISTPVYKVNQNGVEVQHLFQGWHVGSCVTGAGPRVQTNLLQKYADHGAHNAVTTPAP